MPRVGHSKISVRAVREVRGDVGFHNASVRSVASLTCASQALPLPLPLLPSLSPADCATRSFSVCHNACRAPSFGRCARFGPRLANAAKCTISQVPASGKVSEAKQEANEGKPEASVALRVDVISEKALTESDQEDIRAQVVVSGGRNSSATQKGLLYVYVAFEGRSPHRVERRL